MLLPIHMLLNVRHDHLQLEKRRVVFDVVAARKEWG
jgi:hypothetical protein